MPVFPTQLDGQNVVLSITAPDTFVDVMSVNVVTGAVSSAWLPSTWIRPLELAVELSNSVVPPLDRTSVNYLARVLNTLSMDDSVFAASNILTANPDIRSLRITVAVGNDPAVLLLNLPHSITGAFAVADGAQGVAPPVILAGDVVGPSNTNQLVAYGPGAVTRGAADKSAIVTTDTKGRVFTLTEAAIQIAEAQVTGIVIAAIAENPATVTEVVRAGVGAAPQFRDAIQRSASAAFPGFAPTLAAAAGSAWSRYTPLLSLLCMGSAAIARAARDDRTL